jgi:phage tail-like protein
MSGVLSAISNLLDPSTRPFTAFNFLVEIRVDGVSPNVCGGAFAECDGLEMTLEPRTIREGGRNYGPVHLAGPVSYGQLSLKRGMTANMDLWNWFDLMVGPSGSGGLLGGLGVPSSVSLGPGGIGTSSGTGTPTGALRATAEIVMLAADGVTEQVHFTLTGCLPVKLKAPSLNAKEGLIAVEELSLVYESMKVESGQSLLGAAVSAVASALG